MFRLDSKSEFNVRIVGARGMKKCDTTHTVPVVYPSVLTGDIFLASVSLRGLQHLARSQREPWTHAAVRSALDDRCPQHRR